MMLQRILRQGMLVSIIQGVIIFILFGIQSFFSAPGEESWRSELALVIGFWLFLIIAGVVNLVIAIVNRKAVTVMLSILAGLLFSMLWVEDLPTFTWPTVMMIISGLIAFTSGYLLHKKFQSPAASAESTSK